MGETTAVAHGGDHGSRSWGKPRQLLMGGTPKTALPPQDRAASPRPRCIAVPCSLKSRNCVPHSYENCYYSLLTLNSQPLSLWNNQTK
ncbi:MAG: hypothetical protein F6J90_21310 [Moorea sp. SIOASIH]|uniref:hypothetical protein n=1 Tax=Moorena sp. SIOASIH TaxID=2607817 RepID=UPI0013BBBCD6|nr:hypothetical protein [Moorena sp. SIOASIH]NEO38732.1 hypothetical protein [Moorena sp. SIOASIH]